MKVSTALSGVVNVAVIVAIGFFFWSSAGRNAGQQASDDRSSRVDLSAEEWKSLTEGGSHLGHDTAPAFMVEFLDYQCPYCSSVHPMIERYLRGHERKAIVVRHYALPSHDAADGAARAAICAEAQGQFTRMHSRLFESDDWQMDRDWRGLAEEIGIPDIVEFERCLESSETQARIEADRALAAEFGVHATPTFISRHSIHVGTLDRPALSRLASTDRAR